MSLVLIIAICHPTNISLTTEKEKYFFLRILRFITLDKWMNLSGYSWNILGNIENSESESSTTSTYLCINHDFLHHCSLTLWGVLLLSLSEVSRGSYSYHILSIYELVYCSKLVFSLDHLVSTTEQKCQLIWHYSNYWPACCCWAALKFYVQLLNERMS